MTRFELAEILKDKLDNEWNIKSVELDECDASLVIKTTGSNPRTLLIQISDVGK